MRWTNAFSWNAPMERAKRPAPMRRRKVVITIRKTVSAIRGGKGLVGSEVDVRGEDAYLFC
jgi:hypothetical protein